LQFSASWPRLGTRKEANMASTIRGAAASAAALLVLLLAPGAARAISDHALVATYQPVTVFDPAERFRPTHVQSFVHDSDLEQRESGTWILVDDDPDLDGLPGGTGVWRLNQDSCTPALPLGGLECYDAAEEGSRSTVYGHVARTEGAIVLQYWYFYYDDVYSYEYPASNLLWQAHEGDWEVVNVVLSEDEEPIYVGYSQHCRGERRAWGLTPRLGSHPIVHVAVGSHANVFAAGIHPINLACIPQPVIDYLLGHGLPLPVDYAGEGAVGGPPEAGGILTRIRPLDGADRPSWVDFPGTWGEAQYFHAPPPFGTFAFGASPNGPAQHAVWQDPLGTLAGWPPG
jgi:hypothetical protein